MKKLWNASLKSLVCIRPNAEKNVKPAPQYGATWTVLLWIIVACVSLPESGTYGADNPTPLPGGSSEPPIEQPITSAGTETDTIPSPASNSAPSPNPTGDSKDKITTDTWSLKETLPPITANQFTVQILKRTLSNRVYLLQFSEQIIPKTGEILLLRNQAEAIMAFRVLKVTSADHTLVAQVIRKYDNHPALENGESYDAIVKSGDIEGASDIINAPEAEFEEPNWNVNESSTTILPYDPELDVGSISPAEAAERAKGKPVSPLSSLETKLAFLESKMAALETKNAASEAKVERDTVEVNNSAPKGSSEKESSGTNKADNKADADKPTEKLDDDLFERDDAATPHESLAVDEIKLFDNYAHWLSAGFGYVTNNSPNGQGAYNFSAGNLKYGITIGRRIIFDRPHVQDSLVLEGGIYVYKAINFAAQGDSYTLLSTAANLRYNIFFSESFGIFGYAGMLQSNVLGSSLPVASAITALNSVLPSVGAGILLQIGPSWYAKLVIGLDDTSLNLLLRF